MKEFWEIIEGNTRPLIWDWYLDVICDHLEALYLGRIKNLIINIPPRFLKSITGSVMFPAWIWQRDPSFRTIFASYSQRLSNRDSIKTRRIIQSNKYQSWFGDSFQLSHDQNQITKFSNNYGGHRIATSVSGLATGEGGDLISVDDPTNVAQAMSEKMRFKANDWWDNTFQGRLDDKINGRRLIVMQRLHNKDLTGHILAQELGYEHLCIPMEREETQVETSLGWKDPRPIGGFLNPVRYNEAQKKIDIVSMGSFGYAGQMQQRPVPREGGIIKVKDLMFYKVLPSMSDFEQFVITVDLPFKKTDKSSLAVMDAWGKIGANFYLIDKLRGRMGYREIKNKFKAFIHKHNYITRRLIEDKANGSALISDLEDVIPGLIEYNPGSRDKEQRVHLVSPFFEAGNIWLPENALYYRDEYGDYREELTQFPNYGIDDDVDTMTMAILDLNQTHEFFGEAGTA